MGELVKGLDRLQDLVVHVVTDADGLRKLEKSIKRISKDNHIFIDSEKMYHVFKADQKELLDIRKPKPVSMVIERPLYDDIDREVDCINCLSSLMFVFDEQLNNQEVERIANWFKARYEGGIYS